MKKYALIWLVALMTTTYAQDGGHHARPTDEEIIAHLQRQTPQNKTPAPEWVTDGVYSGVNAQSLIIKSVVKDGFFEQYMDIYYPHHQLMSHTPLVDGIPHGWSEHHRPSGTKMRRILYHHGKIIKVEHFDDKGNLNQTLYAPEP
ncbi:MAG: hypothetical protein Q3971_04490 [Moraxella sp.]|nr:hypothetical protein [Moraxella sp.]